ncbi:porin family protein [Bradyrhizobium sp. AUGA SZCCT0222]|uniref:outer membrane protein n=1 Tax=Bradyrhizobium sp. AUGA SZCCT0222 TaxID=2807668 RepID=UPI001BA725AB|nr:outer membrane beta-barrel protein [Bradyrhizobium sp. AUGA SZCCT0222]MBR1272908.1 porin family protein [Bradyrhizobium sp. AUGA SZCCT0222]
MTRQTSLWLSAAALGALLPTASRAADLPVKAVPAPVVAVYNWTGFYIGGHVGYGQGMKDWLNSSFDYEVKGFLGGGQIGFNQQVGNVVFGIEGDASWTDIKRTQALTLGGPLIGFTQTGTGSTRIDGLATLTGRVGLAQDRWLVYVKGGAAWVHEKHNFDTTLTNGVITQTATAAGSEDRLGLVVGIGSEWAFWGNWSFKSEYNYIHLGNRDVRLTGTTTTGAVTTPITLDVDLKQSLHLAKFGVNYRFGPDAPPAIAAARPAPGHNWTGAWVGAQAGYGWGGMRWPDFFPNDTFNTKGWLGGLSTGANVQAGVFVVGAESEWLYTDVKGGRRDVQNLGFGFTQTSDLASKVDWLWLNSVRVGFVAADKWLVYAKGGVAFAHEKHNLAISQVIPGVGSQSIDSNGRALHTGYLAGVGVEYAFLGNWSAKFEYNYLNFDPQDVQTPGTQTINAPPQVGSIANVLRLSNITQDMHLVKFGINYHFNPLQTLVTAKY